jgi:hypothetical protein
MRMKFEGEVTLSDQEVIAALDGDSYNSKEEIRENLEGAEFPVVIGGVRFMFSVTSAEIDE